MEQKIKNIIIFLNDIERLKSVTRHSWTSTGRQESVPEHCWRMALMAMILKENFPGVDIARVTEMCLIHDFGEVYDGDVPAFLKNSEHKLIEEKAIKKVIEPLSENLQNRIIAIYKEFEDWVTPEAKLAKAIDKLEVLIQHNEADISTWIPKEYELNLTHGLEYNKYNDFIKSFRNIVDQMTRDKILKRK
ncbi:MAG: HD domain-containing protein [Patescibacteria group bacterium]